MKNNGGTRERILDAAQAIFIEKGYEDTTVRMILDASETVAGSFYHFFSSKEALFEAVVDRFMTEYNESFAAALDSVAEPADFPKMLVREVGRGSEMYFGQLQADKLHWTMVYALHTKTILTLQPAVYRTVQRMIADGKVKSRIDTDTQTLAAMLLNGIEGILHAHGLKDTDSTGLERIGQTVMDYIGLLFEFPKV